MENQCKNCIFSKFIHEKDIIEVGKEDDVLFCPMFKEGIPKNILNDEEKCIAKIDK